MSTTPTPSPTARVLTEREAAAALGLQPATLRQSRWTGRLAGVKAPTFIRMGRNIRYRAEDLDAWLDQFEEVCP
ncbi:helix-turn-helix domain-containing protein [uncultured Halomonas sp.]|uniref:helix-turn-helix domain-containing protein n=1 Tax=uncultured Halomonas sp. TaxID=173971 RepID=UPI002622FF15|nr:helix-turn-helix domain-containing protein [uncultured Halomonas sp.]